ncbi:thrombospondin type-1 domain-containing protein 4 [Clupea harengus]|uniref:Thrombospondin type-1 domain-containing protein 4 n=1 Tax=Clupea harengus TaxID=7950 RepID=A0A6P8EWE3_CLUHA|nr:thrombospondin type-1 domain-containing protein 4 [Clupea harengus]
MAQVKQQHVRLWCSLLLTLLSCLHYPAEGASPLVASLHPTPEQECEGSWHDVCGVCAGNSSSCELVSGTFSLSVLPVGYHRVLEIPSGARQIKIQETVKSRNYLALRTPTGQSVINGNWAIDRPGHFQAAGTQFTYQRPNEIRSRAGESITAHGPLSQDLHLYVIYQQPNPSISYEYIRPKVHLLRTHSTDSHTHSHILPLVETRVVDDNRLPSDPITPKPLPLYTWVAMTTAPCSTTCGIGKRQIWFRCVERATQITVPGDFCNHTLRPAPQEEKCSIQHCPAFWDVGEWSECSRTCGLGLQNRQVLCRQTRGHHGNVTVTVTVEMQKCSHTEMPETAVPCQLKICSEWQIQTEWTECSVPCGVGQRSREVECVSSLGDVEDDDQCNLALKPPHLQNCDMGSCARSWYYSTWSQRCSADCGSGWRSRSVACIDSAVSVLPLDGCEGERPAERSVCDLGSCQHRVEWYTGPWGQCSSECGNGTQSRGVLCVLQSHIQWDVTSDTNCSHLPRPPDTQTCHLGSCGAQWYLTDWSSCSRSCEGGYRVREVRCLGDDMTPTDGCDPSLAPESREECNTQPCPSDSDESCRDLYFNCEVVVQAQLCVYNYYRTACCASCSRGSKRDSHPGVR